MRLVYTISAIFAVIALIAPVTAVTVSCDQGFSNCVQHCNCSAAGAAPDCNGNLGNNQWVDCQFHCQCTGTGLLTPPLTPTTNARRPGKGSAPRKGAAPVRKGSLRAPARKASLKAPARKASVSRGKKGKAGK